MDCAGAWEEDDDSCKVDKPLTCSTEKDTSDAICECKEKPVVNAAKCALDFGGFVEGILDSIVYIWSASKRCATPESEKYPGIACVEDVSASVESCLGSLDNLVSLLKPCGLVAGEVSIFGKCVDSIGGLLANTAGLVKSSAMVADYCTEGPAISRIWKATELGRCFANVGKSAKSLLGLSMTLSGIAKYKCVGKMCTAAILILVHVAAKFGEAFALAFNDCSLSPVGGKGSGNEQAECAGAIFGVVDGLTGLAAHGYIVGKKCSCDATGSYKTIRRYIEGEEIPEGPTNSNSMTFAIAAAIPLAALVSFIGGLRFGKREVRRTSVHSLDVQELE
jgi:hypothetical protein